ncbi:MAG: peptidoglycan DD-metalloendopeptidase family protein [bacterium]|nr:peptidoglycan DD-metalloendopeptidase family protein [bacterium]MDZ4284891.1 peptidoglycan DD-metalloendopeptidase family protein [Patescibacteria group bacterium]
MASLLAAGLLLAPVPAAEASVLGFFSSIFGEHAAAETADREPPIIARADSQLLPLLSSLPVADPARALRDDSITIVSGTALLSETGPADITSGDRRGGSDQISIYVVRPGDSLSEIADMFGVSVNTIVWANDIERHDLVRAGQTLVILPVSGVRYEVRAGDTLKSIASRYKGDLDEIRQYNDLEEGATLAVGDTVIIPDGEIARSVPTAAASGRSARSTPSYEGYYLRPVLSGRRTQGIHGYNGIDLGARVGTEILAAADGEVILSKRDGWNGGYGTYIVIAHENGTQTLYAHNSLNVVSFGQRVVRGEVIGYIGATGKATGPHLHFEVRGARNPF